VNNNTKRFPGNRSKKISKNVIIITERDFPKEEGSFGEGRRERREIKRATKEVKKESLKERENLKRTSTTTVDWMDCISVSRERD
jgi:hypothetical protein